MRERGGLVVRERRTGCEGERSGCEGGEFEMLNFVMVMASTNHVMKCSPQTQPTLTFELELFSMSITGII